MGTLRLLVGKSGGLAHRDLLGALEAPRVWCRRLVGPRPHQAAYAVIGRTVTAALAAAAEEEVPPASRGLPRPLVTVTINAAPHMYREVRSVGRTSPSL